MSHLLTTFIIGLAVICLPVISAQDDCTRFVNDIWAQRTSPNAATQTQEQKWYFAYSGRTGRVDLGERVACEDTQSMRYYVLTEVKPILLSTTGGYSQIETGVCVPGFCSKQGLQADREVTQKLFETNNYNISREANVVVQDINESPPRGPGFYLFFIFIFFLVSFSIFSTAFLFQKKRKPKATTETQSRIVTLLEKYLWLCKAFDLKDNAKSLYQTAADLGQSEQTSTFWFLRFFSSSWIVIYHARNESVRRTYEAPSNTGLETFLEYGSFALEYFFVMGGFLVAYVGIGKALKEGVGIRQYISDIFHRLVRVWPPYVFTILLNWVVTSRLVNGPLMGRYVGSTNVCDQVWWTKFLFIENWLPYSSTSCAGYTWYLRVDFQVYFFAVLVVYLYVKKRILGYLGALGLIIFSLIYGLQRQYAGQVWVGDSASRSFEVMIGVIFGFQYYEYVKHKAQKNFFGFCEKYADLRYLLMGFGIYLNYFAIVGSPLGAFEWIIYRRMCMCFGIAFVFLPLANNTVSFIRDFMNLRIFQILGKLSFGVYLLHLPIIWLMVFTKDAIPHQYNQFNVLMEGLKALLITTAVTVPYYLMFEKPIVNIESYFTKRSRQKKAAKSIPTPKIQPKQDDQQPSQQVAGNDQDTPKILEKEQDVVLLIEQNQQIEPLAKQEDLEQPADLLSRKGTSDSTPQEHNTNLLAPQSPEC